MTESIIPVYDNILIKPIEEDHDATESGVVLLADQSKSGARGEVIAVGGGYLALDGTWAPSSICKGDIIIYESWATAAQVNFNNVRYGLLKEKDVLGVIRDV